MKRQKRYSRGIFSLKYFSILVALFLLFVTDVYLLKKETLFAWAEIREALKIGWQKLEIPSRVSNGVWAREIGYEIIKEQNIKPPILYQEIIFPDIRNARCHLILCDIKDPHIQIKPVIAGDKIAGLRETVESMTRRSGAVVGVNASYYGYWNTTTPIGDLLGQIVIDGEIVSSINQLRPWHNGAFGITENRDILIERPLFLKAVLTTKNNETFKGLTINPLDWQDKSQILIYTDRVGNIPIKLKSKKGYLLKLLSPERLIVNTTIKAKVMGEFEGVAVPEGNYCLIYGLKKAEEFIKKNVKKGDVVYLSIIYPKKWRSVKQVIGGAPQILKDGEIIIKDEPMELENRTAIGVTQDGKMLIVCSENVTWYETAEMMKRLDTKDALMLDGGGSTSLIIEGRNVFKKQRCVGDSLLIYYNEK